jgi:VWFA-related protein
MRVGVTVALAVGLGAPVWLGAQSEPSPTPQTVETFGVEAKRVLLDVVVRDKHDEPVTDLEKSDFEVYEDGEPQQIDLFEVIQAPEPAAPVEPAEAAEAAPGPAPAPSREPEIALIAFVFDRLSPDARSQAKKAALTYLEGGRRESDRVGVFVIDLSLITLQGYTNDPALIRRAIEEAAGRATSTYASSRGRQRDIMEQAGAGQQAPVPSGGGPPGPGAGAAASAAGGAAAEAQLRAIEMRMLRGFEALERDEQGYATTNGLLAVVNSMRLMPGRKTVVFFSEGLSIPPAVQAHFESVISEANRANVSIYAMDAAGLRTESVMAETRREMIAAAQQQARQRASGQDFTGGALSKQLERNEDLLRLNPHSGLGQLAGETGGFLVRDTNDLRDGFRRINQDMRFYYMLSYEPSNPDYDGRFRNIDVKVRRSGVKVRTREGYYAIQETEGPPVLPFEVPAIALLDQPTPASSFPTRARGLTFPQPDRPGLAPILVQVPGGVLTVSEDEEAKTYVADFVIMARIKDEDGQVKDRLTQSYHLTGPLEEAEAARAGGVLFYREAELLPGRYTLETVAYDSLAKAGAVRTSPLIVPQGSPDQLRLGSLVLIDRVEQLPEADRDPTNPLCFGEVLIYPNLGEPIQKSERDEALFFVTIYWARSGDPPEATLEILRDGTTVGRAPTALPEPDASGRIQHVLGLPVAQFPPGSYELRVTVSDDRGRDTQSATFTVEG